MAVRRGALVAAVLVSGVVALVALGIRAGGRETDTERIGPLPPEPLRRSVPTDSRQPQAADGAGERVAAREKLLDTCRGELDLHACYIAGSTVAVAPRDVHPGPGGEPTDCATLVDALPCHPDLAVTRAQRDEHVATVEAALAALEASCATFRESDWFLDCDRVPCVVGVPLEGLPESRAPAFTALCDSPLIGGEVLTQQGSATLVPLYAMPDDPSGAVLEGRWRLQRSLRWKELATFPGFTPSVTP